MSESNGALPWKKVAVTGAAGNIGGAVARRLHALGYELVLFDKRPAADPVAPFIQTDLRDRDTVRRALDGVDAVCHLGEVPNVLPGMTGDEVFEINTALCRTMLDVSREIGVRKFLYTSSCQRYGYWGSREFPRGQIPAHWPLDERVEAMPTNGYARSKAVNEEQCAAVASEAMQIFSYRFPAVFHIRSADPKNRYWANADLYLYEGWWTYLAMSDAVEAYVLGLNPQGAERTHIGAYEAFHFVADDAVGEEPVRSKLARFLPDWPALPADWPDHRPPVSCEKALRLLGWRSQCHIRALITAAREQSRG